MNTKKIVSTLAVVGVIGLMAANSALAYQGDYTQKGPNCTPERHEAMTAAFANQDYNAWQELMTGKGRVAQVVNESNFNRFAEAHQLALNGDYEGADTIRKELGLRGKDGVKMGAGFGQGMGQGRMAK